MRFLPTDPTLPLPPSERWPEFAELRGFGRKTVLIFLLLISGVAYLGMSLNLFFQLDRTLGSLSRPLSARTLAIFAETALHGFVAVNCYLMLRSRRGGRSRAFLILLAVLDLAAVGVFLFDREKGDTLLDQELALIFVVFRAGFPLLAMGSLLALQWLPLVQGWRPVAPDGESAEKPLR